MRTLVVAVAVLAGGIASAEEEPLRDTHERLNGVLWMQTSAEYKTLCAQTYGQAWAQVSDLVAKTAKGYGVPSAAVEQRGFNSADLPYAVILDIDETVLDNSPMSGRLIETRRGYTSENWSNWVDREQAEFVPGADEFVTKAREAGIKVFFVTNRSENEEAHTITDLLPIAATDDDILASREKDPDTGDQWLSEKTVRRAHLAKSYWILAMIGDDLADFIPDIRSKPAPDRVAMAEKYQQRFGAQWFLLPNPVYGSWEAGLVDLTLPDDKQLQKKLEQVKSYKPEP